jgi:hypothetical protein
MTLTLALVVALALAVQDDTSQTRPVLTGTWIPVNSKLADYELQIRHEGNALIIETPIFRVRGATNTLMTSTRVGMQRKEFALDGTEVRHGVVGRVTDESVSRAAWSGNRIVIVTHTTLTAPSLTDSFRQPSGPSNTGSRRQTTWETYSLDANGQLVVERLMTTDPSPSTYAKSPPVVTRMVYRKT